MSVVVATIVKNETQWFLRKAVETWCNFADRIVCIDDGSDDGSGKVVGLTAEANDTFCAVRNMDLGLFGNDYHARAELWELACEYSEIGDYIYIIDADIIPASDPTPYFTADLVLFRYFDLWNASEYRDDVMWTAHHRPRPWAYRKKKKGPWSWPPKLIHSSHMPANLDVESNVTVPLECSILHYGYATPERRKYQYDKYLAVADLLEIKEKAHVESINHANPRLRALPFEPEWTLI